jgi:hypothetical protein
MYHACSDHETEDGSAGAGLAGVPTPPSMDGRSIAHVLITQHEQAPAPTRALLEAQDTPSAWRTEQLIECHLHVGSTPIATLCMD